MNLKKKWYNKINYKIEFLFKGVDFSNVSLPFYGNYTINDNKLKFFRNVKNKKVLDLGCGQGLSLKYLLEKNASELWGIDISNKMINIAKENLKGYENVHLIKSTMEKNNTKIPKNYFDYVIAIYTLDIVPI